MECTYYIPVRLSEYLVMIAPVVANPTMNGQFRFHSRLKNTGHGSNFLILSLSLSLSSLNFSFLLPSSLKFSRQTNVVVTSYSIRKN